MGLGAPTRQVSPEMLYFRNHFTVGFGKTTPKSTTSDEGDSFCAAGRKDKKLAPFDDHALSPSPFVSLRPPTTTAARSSEAA